MASEQDPAKGGYIRRAIAIGTLGAGTLGILGTAEAIASPASATPPGHMLEIGSGVSDDDLTASTPSESTHAQSAEEGDDVEIKLNKGTRPIDWKETAFMVGYWTVAAGLAAEAVGRQRTEKTTRLVMALALGALMWEGYGHYKDSNLNWLGGSLIGGVPMLLMAVKTMPNKEARYP